MYINAHLHIHEHVYIHVHVYIHEHLYIHVHAYIPVYAQVILYFLLHVSFMYMCKGDGGVGTFDVGGEGLPSFLVQIFQFFGCTPIRVRNSYDKIKLNFNDL